MSGGKASRSMRYKNIELAQEDVSMYVPEGENYRVRFPKLLEYYGWEDKHEKVHTFRIGSKRFTLSIEKEVEESNSGNSSAEKLDKVA